MQRFKVIDHPTDTGIEAFGGSKKELFQNAAIGMMEMMFVTSGVKPDRTFNVIVKGDDLESLLVAWLSELIYLADSKKAAFCGFEITRLNDNELEATVHGGKINIIKHAIKAVTDNRLKIENTDGIFKTRIVFDV